LLFVKHLLSSLST